MFINIEACLARSSNPIQNKKQKDNHLPQLEQQDLSILLLYQTVTNAAPSSFLPKEQKESVTLW